MLHALKARSSQGKQRIRRNPRNPINSMKNTYLILGVSLKHTNLRASALAVEVTLVGDLLQPAGW